MSTFANSQYHCNTLIIGKGTRTKAKSAKPKKTRLTAGN
jgi:hypothetical protein